MVGKFDVYEDLPLTPGQYVLRKLPHITALFWAIKILATTLGETAGDFFSQTLGLGTLRAAVLLFAIVMLAQRFGEIQHGSEARAVFSQSAEFHFIRTEYTDLPEFHRGYGFGSRNGRGSGWWLVDWPAADNHFTYGIQRLTRIDIGDPRHLRLLDDKIFDYPWIYATQTGWWDLSDKETDRLREYLLRGGFLMTDDFWGPGGEQWEVFRRTMNRVFPDKEITEIDESDSSMHVLYDIREKDRTFIPGSRHLRRAGDGSVCILAVGKMLGAAERQRAVWPLCVMAVRSAVGTTPG